MIPHDHHDHTAELTRILRTAEQMPGRLAEARAVLGNLKSQLESATDLVKDRAAETSSLIFAETLPDSPKPVFPNKESRDAELRKRLAEDPQYLALVSEEEQAQRRKAEAEIQLARVQDEDKFIDRQLEAVTASLRAETIQELRQAITALTTVEAQQLARKDAS